MRLAISLLMIVGACGREPECAPPFRFAPPLPGARRCAASAAGASAAMEKVYEVTGHGCGRAAIDFYLLSRAGDHWRRDLLDSFESPCGDSPVLAHAFASREFTIAADGNRLIITNQPPDLERWIVTLRDGKP
ncbi:MAG TPA: hypothetical protein VFF06_28250, partial [Polyangia bacterium]|nr:hypothetical protein [Polyangia bacterium]